MSELATLLVVSARREESSVAVLRDRALARVVEAGLRPLGDRVRLVVSELVTNAVRYGTGAEFDLKIVRTGDFVRIEVDDRTPGTCAILRQPDETFESGRGLLIVDAVSASWGTSADGRVTWSVLSVAECEGEAEA